MVSLSVRMNPKGAGWCFSVLFHSAFVFEPSVKAGAASAPLTVTLNVPRLEPAGTMMVTRPPRTFPVWVEAAVSGTRRQSFGKYVHVLLFHVWSSPPFGEM